MSKGRASFSVLAVVALAASAFALSGSAATAAATKVTICHRTNSDTNPYVQISPSANGVLNGHSKHDDPFIWAPGLKASGQKWGDIIPAFGSYPGLNLTTEGGFDGNTTGQEILDNGCVVPNNNPEPPPPPPVGSLSLTKTVLGTPAGDPVPTSYDLHVVCDGDQFDDVVTLEADETTTIDNLLDGTVCTVTENGVDTFADGTVVSYTPAIADTDGVEIVDDTTTNVTVTNDFTGVSGEVVTVPGTTPAPIAAPVAVVAVPALTG